MVDWLELYSNQGKWKYRYWNKIEIIFLKVVAKKKKFVPVTETLDSTSTPSPKSA